MTEKRFTSNNGVFYTDNYTGWEFQSYGEVVTLLNDLNDENQQLRQLIEKNKTKTDKTIKEIVDETEQLKKEKQGLLKRIDDYIWEWEDEGTPVADEMKKLKDDIERGMVMRYD